ncbi:MAG TPA: hypothetical protein VEA36_02725 [Candidatus Paceibacterota bacterium]|nr:hypothetical protein [Candidatus Paceibacterota bacterium]
MKGTAVLLTLILLIPGVALASTVRTDRTLVISEPISDNAYLAGTDVNVSAPLGGDLLSMGGTLTIAAPVAGDAFLAGGTIDVKRPVQGDVRAAGGRILIEDDVAGDLVLAGGSVEVTGTASSTRVAGGNVRITGGATGPAVVYGGAVYLAGEFLGDVEVTASDRLMLAEGTRIHGTLRYNTPQQAGIPASAIIDGGVEYTGGSSYLPTVEEAKRFAVAGAGVFFVASVIAAVIAAGLLAGLFPGLSERVTERTLAPSPRRFVLHTLLGFAIVVAAPVLILFLLLSFVGTLVALMLALAYVFLLILGYLYAGIIAGAALARGLFKRSSVSWRFAVLGMFVLYVIGVIPVFGKLVILVLSSAAIGAIAIIAYRFAFPRADDIEL